jgi:SNF2 family DNA or RNA helicase
MFTVEVERIPKKQSFILKFNYNIGLVETIKATKKEGRKYNDVQKNWILTVSNLYDVISHYIKSDKIFFNFINEDDRAFFKKQFLRLRAKEVELLDKKRIIEERKIKAIQFKKTIEVNYLQYYDEVTKHIKDKSFIPYPHQIAGVKFLEVIKSGALLFEMGLGKSIVSIIHTLSMDYKKILVIVPNNLKFNYLNEIEKFTNEKAYIIGIKSNKYDISECRYIIVNYDFYSRSSGLETKLKKYDLLNGVECLICDEAHYLKNSDSNRYRNVKKYHKGIENKVFLTGTPAPSRIREIYNMMNLISDIEFSSKEKFYTEYLDLVYNPEEYGWVSKYNVLDSVESGEFVNEYAKVYEKLQPFVYRKTKEEVLKDLPDKVFNDVIIELSDKDYREYSSIARQIMAEGKPEIAVRVAQKQFTANFKSNPIIDLIEIIVMENDKKLVIVDQFKEPLRNLYNQYKDISAYFTGDSTLEERNAIVKDFQNPNGKIKIIFGIETVIKEGLTLTEASDIVVCTLSDVPGTYDQVVDRLHRIGQKSSVNVYNIICRDTVDEKINDMLKMKRKEISLGIDNKISDYKSNDISLSEVITINKK